MARFPFCRHVFKQFFIEEPRSCDQSRRQQCRPPLHPKTQMSEPIPEPYTQAWLVAALARFERPLMRYALGLTHDLETARDVVQDTFLRLSREVQRQSPMAAPGAEGGEPGAGPRALPGEIEALAPWLFTVCRNRMVDLNRKNSRLVTMDTALLDATPAHSPAAEPDSALSAKDDSRRIRHLISHLPEKQRHLLKLKFESGLNYKEIAAATGLTSGNIGWIIHQAVQSLRSQWAAENA
jgi:RNA polymerase sigma factor (sigma-70 family)